MSRLYDVKTGKLHDMPSHLITEKVRSGKYVFVDDDQIMVMSPDGNRYKMPGKVATSMILNEGGVYPSKDEWTSAGEKKAYGEGPLNYLGAPLVGAGRAFAPFVGDALAKKIVGENRYKYWNEKMSGSMLAGEVAGYAGLAAMTGGLGLAARGAAGAAGTGVARKLAYGASDVLLPGKAVMKFARNTEASIAAKAALGRGTNTSLARKIVSAQVPGAVGNAIEGGVYGLASTFTEDQLGNPQEASDYILSGIGGALFGAGAGVGLNALMVTGVAGTKKLGDGLAGIAKVMADNPLTTTAENQIAKLGSKVFGDKPSETILKQYGVSRQWREARDIVSRKKGPIRAGAQKMKERLATLGKRFDTVDAATERGHKEVVWRKKLFEGIDESEAVPGAIGKIKEKLSLFGTRVDDYFDGAGDQTITFEWVKNAKSTSPLSKLISPLFDRKAKNRQELLNGYLERVANLTDAKKQRSALKDLYLAMDDFKKGVGDYRWGYGAKTTPQGELAADRVFGDIQKLLEDSVWGVAGRSQEYLNTARHSYIVARGKVAGLAGQPQLATVNKFLDDATKNGGGTLQRELSDYLTAGGEWVETANKIFGFGKSGAPAGIQSQFRAAGAASEGIKTLARETQEIAQKVVDEANVHRAIFGITGANETTTHVTGALLGRAGKSVGERVIRKAMGGWGSTVGWAGLGAFGGIPAVAAAGVVAGLSNAARTARALVWMQHLAQKSKKSVDDGLNQLVSKMTTGGPSGKLPMRSAATRTSLLSAAKLKGDDSEETGNPKDDYRAARRRAKILANPEVLASTVQEMIEPIKEAAPELAVVFEKKITRILNFSVISFGPTMQTPEDVLLGVPEREPNDREISKRAIIDAVIQEPIKEVIENLEAGTCTTTHMETMKACYPDMHSIFVAELIDKISDQRAAGKEFSREYLAQLSILLEKPLLPSFIPENALLLQSNFSDEQEQPQIKSSPLLKNPGMGTSAVQELMA